jgi:hypothetical protein
MTACAIRYRLDGPGPAAFLVDCEGELRVYARGVLGGSMPRNRLLALLAERGCRWVPAGGSVEVNLEPLPARTEDARPFPTLVTPLFDTASIDGAVTANC